MKIELMKENDIQACSVILQKAYEQAPYNEVFELGVAEGHIKSKYGSENKNSFVALDDENEILGFIIVSEDVWVGGKQAVIEEFAVDSIVQHQGVGRSLMEHTRNHLKENGFVSMVLWATKDKRLVDFYTQQGFSVSENSVVMFGKL